MRGWMTGVPYRDGILDDYVTPYAGAIGPQFIFKDDYARPHRARVVEDFLQQETIVRMDWSACSPDLNPNEHVWNMLQLAILRRPVQPRTLVELGNALTEEWNNLETRWKHGTPLPGCDCTMWVTHKLLTVAAGNWNVWDNFVTWNNIMKSPFFGSASLTTECVLPIVHFWHKWNSGNKYVLEYMPCLVFVWYPCRKI